MKETDAPPLPAQRERDDLELVRLLTLVQQSMAARLAAALRAAGASVEEWRVLSFLADGRGHPMTEIAEFAMLPAPTLTKLVDRLVAANRVYRRVDDADRRRVLVFLSHRGRAAHEELTETTGRVWDDLVAAVGREETALLGALLASTAARLGVARPAS